MIQKVIRMSSTVKLIKLAPAYTYTYMHSHKQVVKAGLELAKHQWPGWLLFPNNFLNLKVCMNKLEYKGNFQIHSW